MSPRAHPPSPISWSGLMALALLNSRRHGSRAVVNIAGIAIAVAALLFFLAFFRGTYEGVMFASVIDQAVAQAQVQARNFDQDDPESWADPANLFPPEPARTLAGVPAAPRLTAPAFAGDGVRKIPVLLSGVDFGAEKAVFTLEDRVVSGTFGGPGLTVGAALAKTLNLAVGDEMRLQVRTVDGAPNLETWPVTAVVSTGYPPIDKTLVLADLAAVQNLMSAGDRVNKLFLRAEPGPGAVDRERALGRLGQKAAALGDLGLELRPWQDYARFIVEDSRKDGAFFAVFLAVLLFLSWSTVAGTMQVTVFERRREIGMLRASGWYRSEVGRMFLLEAGVLGVAGSLAGVAAGGLLALALQCWPVSVGLSSSFDLPAFKLTCDLQPSDPILAALAGIAAALAAGTGPALRASRIPILSALAES